MPKTELGTVTPIVVEYGNYKFVLKGAETPGAKPGDKPVFKYTVDGASEPEDDAAALAVAQAVKDFVDRATENEAVKVELARMAAERAAGGTAEDAKKARENVRKANGSFLAAK